MNIIEMIEKDDLVEFVMEDIALGTDLGKESFNKILKHDRLHMLLLIRDLGCYYLDREIIELAIENNSSSILKHYSENLINDSMILRIYNDGLRKILNERRYSILHIFLEVFHVKFNLGEEERRLLLDIFIFDFNDDFDFFNKYKKYLIKFDKITSKEFSAQLKKIKSESVLGDNHVIKNIKYVYDKVEDKNNIQFNGIKTKIKMKILSHLL